MDIMVFDMTGREVANLKNTDKIDTSSWNTGTYIFVNGEGTKQLFVKI